MCGLVGVFKTQSNKLNQTISKINKTINNTVVSDTKNLLAKLQHRGQSSAGIATFNFDKTTTVYKKNGLVSVLDSYDKNSYLAIAHLRYPTMGTLEKSDLQPFISKKSDLILAHNGEITNYTEIKDNLKKEGNVFSSSSDIEPLMFLLSKYTNIYKKNTFSLAKQVEKPIDKILYQSFKKLYTKVQGAFSILGAFKTENNESVMFCARDPYGFRPMFWGKNKTGEFVCSSESLVFNEDFVEWDEVPRGTLLVFSNNIKPQNFRIEQKEEKFCAFELIYFSHQNTEYNKKSVKYYREQLGYKLVEKLQKKNIDIDFISAVPRTALPIAKAISKKMNIPYKEVFIENNEYRTFIMDSTSKQKKSVKDKFKINVQNLENKKILIVDDSIVRGTTITELIDLLKKYKPKAIHIAISSPPILYPCYYGINMKKNETFFAKQFIETTILNKTKKDIKYDLEILELNIAKSLGVNTVSYLSINNLKHVLGKNKCMACLNGEYPLMFAQDFIKKSISKDDILAVNEEIIDERT